MACNYAWNNIRQDIHEFVETLRGILNKKEEEIMNHIDKVEEKYLKKLEEQRYFENQIKESKLLSSEIMKHLNYDLNEATEKLQELSEASELEGIKFCPNKGLEELISNIGVLSLTCKVKPDNCKEYNFNPYFIHQNDDGSYNIVSNQGIHKTDDNLNVPISKPFHKNKKRNASLLVAGMAVNSKNIFVSVRNENKIQVYDLEKKYIKSIGEYGSGPYEFNNPLGICAYKNYLLVTDKDNNRVQVFKDEVFSHFIGDSRQPIYAQLQEPSSVCVTSEENVIVLHCGTPSINVYTLNGEFKQHVSLDIPKDEFIVGSLAVTYKDEIIATDYKNDTMYLLTPNFTLSQKFGEFGMVCGAFNCPYGVFATSDGNVQVCDSQNKRIQRFHLERLYSY